MSACMKSMHNPAQDIGHALRFADIDEVCEIFEVLGAGGCGEVCRARLRATGMPCALKIVPKKRDLAACMARHEADVLWQLNHERVCRLLDAFEDDHCVYLVLELIPGKDLFSLIASGSACLRRDTVCKIIEQLLEALAYCHRSGIVHRDLKLENVIVQGEQSPATVSVKLVDFGIALRCRHGEILRTDIIGTPGFIAPESMCKGAFSAASDIWGVGMVLHTLLSNSVHSISDCDVADIETGRDLIDTLLNTDPDERPKATAALHHQWFANVTIGTLCSAM